MSNKRPKVSVIVPVYNVEKYVQKCIDSILSQTYRDIELIVVSDASPGNITEIMQNYLEDRRVKYIELEENIGLFRARMAGYAAASGEYIMFVDGDDNISVDYIRVMTETAESNKSDIVMAETVIEESDGSKFVYNLANDLPFDSLSGRDVFDKFMEQRGENYMWHVIHSKMIKKSLFDELAEFYGSIDDHIIMCEDILYSIPLWSRARRIDRARTAYYYYYSHDKSSTKDNSIINLERSLNNIGDVFARVEKYLQSEKLIKRYTEEFCSWKNIYAQMWKNRVEYYLKDSEDVQRMLSRIQQFAADKTLEFGDVKYSQFYKSRTVFNPALDNDIKDKIINPEIEVVSFDIFDTLIVRPVYEPRDVFRFLNKAFQQLNTKFRLMEFAQMREEAEERTRKLHQEQEDVTLEQIYETFCVVFNIDKKIAAKMKKLEIEYELKFCFQRKTAKELFDLAKYLDKKVIITTDMYLPREVIERILRSNNFSDYERLYISCELDRTKSNGTIFEYIEDDLGVKGGQILHIGDNWHSDYQNALEASWNATMLPKTMEAINSSNGYFGAPIVDRTLLMNKNSFCMQNLGISTMVAMAANKFFDNPFVSFDPESNFNCSPTFMGYFGLGMQMFGMTDWMLRDMKAKKISHLVLLARDGYLPQVMFNKFVKVLDLHITTEYFYTSRKATVPLALALTGEVIDLRSFNILNEGNQRSLIPLYEFEKSKNSLKKTKFKRLDEESAAEIAEMLDFEILDSHLEKFKKSYNEVFADNSAIFDIGYSGKPSLLFGEIFNRQFETYFMYANHDEARERLGDNLNVFGRFRKMGMREMVISDSTAPSCVGYKLNEKTDKFEPVFDRKFGISYYEKYVLETMQRMSVQMIDDLISVFGQQIDELSWGNYELVSMPINNLFDDPEPADAIVYGGFVQEDDIGFGDIDILNEFYSDKDNIVKGRGTRIALDLASMSRAKRAAYYALFDRSRIMGLNNKASVSTTIDKSGRLPYRIVHRFRKSILKK